MSQTVIIPTATAEYVAVALEASADNGDRYAAQQIRAALATQTAKDNALADLDGLSGLAAREDASTTYPGEVQDLKDQHQRACETIAALYEAGTGRKGLGPIRGVVEDVADARASLEGTVSGLRAELAAAGQWLDQYRERAESAERERDTWRAAESATHATGGVWDRLAQATARVSALEKVATDAQNARQEVADRLGQTRRALEDMRGYRDAAEAQYQDAVARLMAAQAERDELRARIVRATQALEGEPVDTAAALNQAREAHLAHLRAQPESRCVAHGNAPCDQCAQTKPGGLDDLGNCTQCSVYASTGHHWDTCPNRVR